MKETNSLLIAVSAMTAWVRRMREASIFWAECNRLFRFRWSLTIAIILIAGAVAVTWQRRASDPIARAQRALKAGAAQEALRAAGAEQGLEADLVKARALHALKRGDEGVPYYQSAARADPKVLARDEVLSDLASDLGGPRSQDAAELLERAGDRGAQVAADSALDSQNHRRRWAAVELLRRMKREDKLDLFSVYVADLKSGNCEKASKAARSLGEMGDRRAIEPLKSAAAQKRLGIFDSCEAAAAKAALRKLEKP